jgi:hypothetical protein
MSRTEKEIQQVVNHIKKIVNSASYKASVRRIRDDLARQAQGYEREYESVVHYLKKEGYIIPKDYEDFLDWYFGLEKYEHLFVYEAAAKVISDKDFLEYHNYREKKLKEHAPPETPALEQIFDATKPGYSICLQLIKELEFIDRNGNTKPQVKANEILGLAVALKETSYNILTENYTDNELMEVLQKHLKVPFTSDNKRRGKGFDLKKAEAKNYINRFMKKACAS